MIDIKLIRENKDLVKENIKKKFQDKKLPLVDEIYDMDIKYRRIKTEADEARNKVNSLKRLLKELGNVNLGAIEEFDRINERYEFLTKQREDLENAKYTLLEIINEMDQVMEKEFIDSFKLIRENFKSTFKRLFVISTLHCI